MKVHVRRVFDENFAAYGVRKVWRQLKRDGEDVARRTVARLMKSQGFQWIIRGKSHCIAPPSAIKLNPCPLDRVNHQFEAPAPDRLWVSGFA